MTAPFDESSLAARLTATGMRAAPAQAQARALAAALHAVTELSATSVQPLALFVPGRIEVLGKHTDYAGGRSLLATVTRGFALAAVPRDDSTIRILDPLTQTPVTFPFSPDLTSTPAHWSSYAMTVARRLARNFPGPLRGGDIVFSSDLPPAAGMSSSSALLIAIAQTLIRINALDQRPEYRAAITSPETLAAYLATIENGQSFANLPGDRGVGTFGGSEDHTAILCSHASSLALYSFCPTRLEARIPMPGNTLFAIASSGVLAEKTGSAMARYNRVSQLVSEILAQWNRHTSRHDPSLAAALHSAPAAPARLRDLLSRATDTPFTPAELLARLDQFRAESDGLIPAAASALRANNLADFARCVDESQHLAEDLLQNQIPQTRALARSARDLGALAASAFGAGFGGSVWALIDCPNAEPFLAAWRERYHATYPSDAERSTFFLTHPGPAAIDF